MERCSRHAQSFQAYTTGEYLDVLHAGGFNRVEIYPALAEPKHKSLDLDFIVVVAHKAEP